MASSDDDILPFALLGVAAYLLYQYFKQHGFNFGLTPGAPGILPFGAGGTAGGEGGIPGGTTGTGAAVPATSSLPSPIGSGPSGSGSVVCIDNSTLQVVGFPDANGDCPAGSLPGLAINTDLPK